MTKPSDLSPLFSDADASPEELKRARRIVAYEELKEAVNLYRKLCHEIKHSKHVSEDTRNEFSACRNRVFALALELFPEEGEK